MTPRLTRLVVAMVLSTGSAMCAFGVLVGVVAVWWALALPVVPSYSILLSLLVLTSAALAGYHSPTCLAASKQFVPWRRSAAPVVGIIAAVALGAAAEAVGIRSEALSSDPSPRAMAEEAAHILLFFAGLICGAYFVLGERQGTACPTEGSPAVGAAG